MRGAKRAHCRLTPARPAKPLAAARADVTDLSALAAGSFDMVYVGGHVAVWESGLRKFYGAVQEGGRLRLR